jgi:hypothetical protein
MAIAISVSPGKVFVAGQPFDVDDLNAAANPSVTIDGSAGAPVSGSDIQDNTITMAKLMQGAYFYGDGTYSAGLYTINQTPDCAAIAKGQMVIFKADASNASGAVNIKLDTLSAVDLFDQHGNELVAGDIQANDIVFCIAVADAGAFRIIGTLNTNYPRYATSAGTANAQTLDFSPNIPSYAAMTGKVMVFKVGAALSNTTAATLKIDSIEPAQDIKRPDGTALVANDLVAGTIAIVVYNGTNFNLLNPAAFSINNFYTVSGVVYQKVVTIDSTPTENAIGTALPYDDTVPQNTEGNGPYFSTTITPKSATSTLLVTATMNGIAVEVAAQFAMALFLDSEASARAVANTYIGTIHEPNGSLTLMYKMTSGSTSAKTFKIRAGRGSGANGWSFNNGDSNGAVGDYGFTVVSGMTVEEIG